MLELGFAPLFGAFLLGLQHALEPENIAISVQIGLAKGFQRYLIIYLAALVCVDGSLGSLAILGGEHFLRIPEGMAHLCMGLIFISVGLSFMLKRHPMLLEFRKLEQLRLGSVMGAGVLHSFIIDPHHPLFFAALAMLGDLLLAELMLIAFIAGLVMVTGLMILAMALIALNMDEHKLSILKQVCGAITIAVGMACLLAGIGQSLH